MSAILAVHQMGLPCDLSGILALAREYRLPVVEDAACALGSEISFDHGRSWERIGRPHGDLACFSFHPRKVITTGEGGMVTAGSADLDRKVRLLRHQGMDVSDLERHRSDEVIFEHYVTTAYNDRLTDIQAAIGIVQLKKMDQLLRQRKEVARRYHEAFARLTWLKTVDVPGYARTNWQSYPVRLKEGAPLTAKDLMQQLLKEGISTRRGIMNAHQEAPYADQSWTLPESEAARDRVVLLPIFYEMTFADCARIIDAVIAHG